VIRWRRLPGGILRVEIWPLVMLVIVLLGVFGLFG